jgi:Notch-like protein
MGDFGIWWRSSVLFGAFALVVVACSGDREFSEANAEGGSAGSLQAGSAGSGGGSGGNAGGAQAGRPSTGGSTSSGGAPGTAAAAGAVPEGGAGEPPPEPEMGGAGGVAGDDPCEPGPCLHGSCEADGASYTCTCETGYRGENCEIDIDDCEDDPCTNGTCVDAVAAFQCDCGDTGYTGDLCDTLIQNCAETPCSNGGVCTNVGASRTCDCTGTGATGVSCEVDVNECDADPCEHGTCTNGTKQYTCNCAGTGYMGTNCDVDIDECDEDPCDPLTTCTNSTGGFSCSSCPSGYTGTGLTGCKDVNECGTGNGGCDVLTTCTNTAGGRTCGTCPAGYMGNGESGCSDVNECSTNNGGCHSLTTCTNTAGSRTCGACPAGYTGTGATGCTDINDCAGNPCKNGGTCANLVNEFKCTCSSPWSGSTCQNATLTINATARGYYTSADWFPPSHSNTLTGFGSPDFSYAAFLVFPIPNFTGNVSSVTLRLEHESYGSPHTSEVVSVRDVSTSVSTLINTTTASSATVAIYNDLMTGTAYGSLNGWTAATVGTVRSMTLSAGLTAVSNARGSNFALSIMIDSLSKIEGEAETLRFAADTEARTHQLQVVVVPP